MSAPTTLNSFVSGSWAPSLSEGSQQVPMEDESLHALLSDLLDEHLKPNVDYSDVTLTVRKGDDDKDLCVILAIPANANMYAFAPPHVTHDSTLAPAIMRMLDTCEKVADIETSRQSFEVKELHNKVSQPYTIKLTASRKAAE